MTTIKKSAPGSKNLLAQDKYHQGELDDGKTWDSPSLDRIDSKKGYTPENVRVVLHCVNVMANVWGENKIVEIADAIITARRSKSAELQQSLENSLKRLLNTQSSPEYDLTWKHWDMPSGLPICALRASGRRTSDKDYTGWPSPKSTNGTGAIETETRQGSADLQTVAGWATPAATDGSKAPPDHHNRNLTLVGMALASGPTPAGSIAETENTDGYRLNPRFSLWLQGYPVAWWHCAERATQLCLKSRPSSSKLT